MNLTSNLPCIPAVKTFADFMVFSQAGRELAHRHLNYETSEPWPLAEVSPELGLDPWKQFHVSKMTFAKPTPAQKAAGRWVCSGGGHFAVVGSRLNPKPGSRNLETAPPKKPKYR